MNFIHNKNNTVSYWTCTIAHTYIAWYLSRFQIHPDFIAILISTFMPRVNMLNLISSFNIILRDIYIKHNFIEF